MFVSSAFSGILPNGYTELDYIGTNHDAYILTNLTVNDFDRVVSRVNLLDDSGNTAWALFGSREEHSNYEIGKAFYFRTSSEQKIYALCNRSFMANWGSYTPTPAPTNQWANYDIKMSSGEQYVKLDGTSIVSGTVTYTEPIANTYKVALFAHHYVDTRKTPYRDLIANIPNLRCEYITFYKGNNIVANFIPAKRNSDNEIGMYDTVNNMFYTNAGTGTFIAGPAICAATATALDEQICLKDIQPNGLYLPVKYNNNKYYLMLDATHDYPIHKNSDNKLKVIVGNTTYNAHDTSVLE